MAKLRITKNSTVSKTLKDSLISASTLFSSIFLGKREVCQKQGVDFIHSLSWLEMCGWWEYLAIKAKKLGNLKNPVLAGSTSISMSCQEYGGVVDHDGDGYLNISINLDQHALWTGWWCGWCCWWWWCCIIITNLNQHGLCTKSDLHHIRIVVWMMLLTMMVMDVIEVWSSSYPHQKTPALPPRLGFPQQHGEVNRATKGFLFRMHNKQFVSNSTSVQLCTDWERRIFDSKRRRIMTDIKRTKKVKACWTLLDSPLLTPCRFFSCQN